MSAATATKSLMTADAFYEFTQRPENQGRWFELVRGAVIELPPPTKIHGVVAANIGRIVGNFTFARGFGYVTTNDSGIILERDPDTVRGPDVALFEDARSFEELHPKYGENPPVLAVEVITPDTKAGQLNAKVEEYLDAGVKLVWVVDIERRKVQVYTPDGRPRMHTADQELDGGDVLPGFRCKVADFFFVPGAPPEKTA